MTSQMIAMKLYGVIIFLICARCACAESGISVPVVSSAWHVIQSRLGGIAQDGTARIVYPIPSSEILSSRGIALRVEHRIESDFFNRAISRWHISGLQSYLTQRSPSVIVWRPLYGGDIAFDIHEIDADFIPRDSIKPRIARIDDQTFRIVTRSGLQWEYKNGMLSKVTQNGSSPFTFIVRGGMVLEIDEDQFGSNVPLLRADYNESNLPSHIRIGERSYHFEWTPDGDLERCSGSGGWDLIMDYENHLLTRISQGKGSSAQHFTWKKNVGYERGDSRWTCPVHISSDDQFEYEYDVTPNGYKYVVVNKHTGSTSTTYSNPKLLEMSQTSSDGTFEVNFFKRTDGLIVLREVRDTKRHFLETYQCGTAGNPISVLRNTL